MAKETGYTFAIATRKPKQTFVFCKWFTTVEQAIEYAKGEIKDRSQYDVEFILIREGTDSKDDPIIWDSRKQPKPEPVSMEDTAIAQMRLIIRTFGAGKATKLLLDAANLETEGMHPDAVIHRDIQSLEQCCVSMLDNHILRQMSGKL